MNKPLSSAGKQLQSKSFRMETASNEDSSSNPGSPQRSKTRSQPEMKALIPPQPRRLESITSVENFRFRHDSTELDHSENEDITIKRADGTDKVRRPRGGEESREPQRLAFSVLKKSFRSTRKCPIHSLIPLSPW